VAASSEPDQTKIIGTAAEKNASMRYRVAAVFAGTALDHDD
jgi:hypothetical protein